MTRTAKLSKSTDHMITLPIDLEDGGDVIAVTMPLLAWLPRQHVRDMDKWVAEVQELAKKYAEWEEKGGKGKPPCDPATIPDAPHKYQLRVLHAYVSEGDFQRIWNDATPGLAQQIFEALAGEGEIDLGESEASADS